MFIFATWMLIMEMFKIPFLPPQPPKVKKLPDVGQPQVNDGTIEKPWRRSC